MQDKAGILPGQHIHVYLHPHYYPEYCLFQGHVMLTQPLSRAVQLSRSHGWWEPAEPPESTRTARCQSSWKRSSPTRMATCWSLSHKKNLDCEPRKRKKIICKFFFNITYLGSKLPCFHRRSSSIHKSKDPSPRQFTPVCTRTALLSRCHRRWKNNNSTKNTQYEKLPKRRNNWKESLTNLQKAVNG